MALQALERNLGGITGINLAGIRPHHEAAVELGDGQDYRDRTHKLPLPLKEERDTVPHTNPTVGRTRVPRQSRFPANPTANSLEYQPSPRAPGALPRSRRRLWHS